MPSKGLMRLLRRVGLLALLLAVVTTVGYGLRHAAPHASGAPSHTAEGTAREAAGSPGGTPPAARDGRGAGWPACAPEVAQWSGYVDIPGRRQGVKHYFYWAFAPRNGNLSAAPVILWLAGGPGCSSMLSMLTEIGPCKVREDDGLLQDNPHGWNKEAYVIFLDQPAGTGFSRAEREDYDHNEDEVSEDVLQFLLHLFDVPAHRELRSHELFIAGESYAGHYAPATAYRIVQYNEANRDSALRLAGVIVGNGLVDAYNQVSTYPEMAYTYCAEKFGTPCVSRGTYEEMRTYTRHLQDAIAGCNSADGSVQGGAGRVAGCNVSPLRPSDACEEAKKLLLQLRRNLRLVDYSDFNLALPCAKDAPMCYNWSSVERFMNRRDVQLALGAIGEDDAQPLLWQQISQDVYGMFTVDLFTNFNTTVAALLEAKVRVLFFAGDTDFMCNWLGAEKWMTELQWSGHDAFAQAHTLPFRTLEGQYAGTARVVGDEAAPVRLGHARVFDAGHFATIEQPLAIQALLHHFLHNEKLC